MNYFKLHCDIVIRIVVSLHSKHMLTETFPRILLLKYIIKLTSENHLMPKIHYAPLLGEENNIRTREFSLECTACY